MSSSIYLAIPLMALLVVLQSTVLPHFPIFGVVPQILLLVTVAWGLLRGMREGVLWAFVAGIFVDLFSASPMGATSLALIAAVIIAVLIQQSFPESRVFMPVVLALLATLVFWFVYLLLLRLTMPFLVGSHTSLGSAGLAGSARFSSLLSDIAQDYGLNKPTLDLVMLTALVHGLLILPVYWAFHGLGRVLGPRRVEI